MHQLRRAGVALAAAAVACTLAASAQAATFQPSQWVDPFIGTAPGDTDFGTGGGGGNVRTPRPGTTRGGGLRQERGPPRPSRGWRSPADPGGIRWKRTEPPPRRSNSSGRPAGLPRR